MITIDTSREAVAPERIWLQTSGDYAAARTAGPELTWCDRPQGDGDHEYVRADLYATLKAERERLRTAVRRANEMVPSISTPLMRGDNLATLLCSSFSEGGEEDDTGWDAAATAGYEEVIAAIRSHYAAALGDA